MLIPLPKILWGITEHGNGGIFFANGVTPTTEQQRALEEYNEALKEPMVIIED